MSILYAVNRSVSNLFWGLLVLFVAACSPPKVVPPVPVLLKAVQLVYYDNGLLQRIRTTHDSLTVSGR